MLTTLNGYKTYAIAILGVIYAVSGFLTGHMDANTALELIGSSGAIASLRHAIDKGTPSA